MLVLYVLKMFQNCLLRLLLLLVVGRLVVFIETTFSFEEDYAPGYNNIHSFSNATLSSSARSSHFSFSARFSALRYYVSLLTDLSLFSLRRHLRSCYRV